MLNTNSIYAIQNGWIRKMQFGQKGCLMPNNFPYLFISSYAVKTVLQSIEMVKQCTLRTALTYTVWWRAVRAVRSWATDARARGERGAWVGCRNIFARTGGARGLLRAGAEWFDVSKKHKKNQLCDMTRGPGNRGPWIRMLKKIERGNLWLTLLLNGVWQMKFS